MALTAMGIGTKQAPDNVNLDPQRQFWSWLSTFKNPDELGDSGHHERAYFSGFACTQTSPAGMSIQIGGGDEVDSAAIFISSDRAVLLSTDGTPQTVPIPTAPASGSRIDAVVSYIDTSSPSAGDETPGTPEYVKTIVVSGTASGSPSAPTDSQIISALPAGANAKYYRWCDVRVAQGATTITNSNITDKKPASPNVYSASILDLIYPIGAIAIGAKPSIGKWERIQGRFLWASNTAHPAGSTGGEETHKLTVNEMPSHTHTTNRDMNTWDGSKVGYDFNYGQGTGAPIAAGSNILNNTGGNQAHNNMPPYLSVDMWRRTA